MVLGCWNLSLEVRTTNLTRAFRSGALKTHVTLWFFHLIPASDKLRHKFLSTLCHYYEQNQRYIY
jgi:hypothetical protein